MEQENFEKLAKANVNTENKSRPEQKIKNIKAGLSKIEPPSPPMSEFETNVCNKLDEITNLIQKICTKFEIN